MLQENIPQPGTIRALMIIMFLMGAVFLLRMATPDDLRNRDQVKVCAYILDAAYNGNWICQTDSFGDITSKPPLYNWLGALMVLLFGVGIECLQYVIPYRTFNPVDIVANVVGIGAGMLVAGGIRMMNRKKFQLRVMG